jgi:hypothetical protein
MQAKDKDFIMAVNWKKAEEYVAQARQRITMLNIITIFMTKAYTAQNQNC